MDESLLLAVLAVLFVVLNSVLHLIDICALTPWKSGSAAPKRGSTCGGSMPGPTSNRPRPGAVRLYRCGKCQLVFDGKGLAYGPPTRCPYCGAGRGTAFTPHRAEDTRGSK